METRLRRAILALRRRRMLATVVADSAVLVLAYVVLSYLRYENGDAPWRAVGVIALVAVGTHLAVSWLSKLYRGRARVGSVEETILLCLIALATTTVVSFVNVAAFDIAVARSVPVGAAFMATALMVLARAVWRHWSGMVGRPRGVQQSRALVVGAGEAGQQLVQSMLNTWNSPYRPVALVDDDSRKRHLKLSGVPMRGEIADLAKVVRQDQIDTVVVAIPSAKGEVIDAILEQTLELDVETKVLPPVAGLLGPTGGSTAATIRDVRDIDVTDVLGRGIIETDVASIAHFLAGKRVLVTGAGGSIGAELSRQIAQWEPAELMLLDRDESALHAVQLDLHGHGLLDSRETILADIRDEATLFQVFQERRPEVVFHAAALKHLPLLERYPVEGIKTNVLGTRNVLRAADAAGVERFVNVSTDKAADPTSVLGMTKRVAERLTASYARHRDGVYLSVRFGNVLGSRGSVLTAWASQIARGGPVTVTDPEVTRYFMTIPEACQLVLQAGAIGSDGEVLILDMGEPVRLDDVARKLIRQSGQRIEVVYTGLRDGEKLHEVLRSDTEADHRPRHELISHVAVQALAERMVREEVVGHHMARELLSAWCASEADADRPVPSSTENGAETASQMTGGADG